MYIELTTQGINLKVGLTDDDFYKMTSIDDENISEDRRLLNKILRDKFEKLGPAEKEFFKILNFDFIVPDSNEKEITLNFGIGMNKILRSFTTKIATEIYNKFHAEKGDLNDIMKEIGTGKPVDLQKSEEKNKES